MIFRSLVTRPGFNIVENKLRENEISKLSFDGYDFGDRALEGVIFIADITLMGGKPIIGDVDVLPEHSAYLDTLNRQMWLGRAKTYAKANLETILDDAGFEIPAGMPKNVRKPPRLHVENAMSFLKRVKAKPGAVAPPAGILAASTGNMFKVMQERNRKSGKSKS